MGRDKTEVIKAAGQPFHKKGQQKHMVSSLMAISESMQGMDSFTIAMHRAPISMHIRSVNRKPMDMQQGAG